MGPAEGTDSGYRTYGPEELAILGFIRQAKAVGLRLEEIRTIIDLQRSGRQPCGTVIDLLDSRLADIDRTLADLKTLRATMAASEQEPRRPPTPAMTPSSVASSRPQAESGPQGGGQRLDPVHTPVASDASPPRTV